MTDELEPLTPADGLALYLDDMQAEYADATLYGKRYRLQHLVRWCDEQDINNLNELTGRKLQQYRIWRREDGDLNSVSLKTQMDSVRVWMRWLATVDAVPQGLAEKVLSPSIADGEDVDDAIVTSEHAHEILKKLHRFEYASIRHVSFHLLWKCALRRGALVATDVEDYSSEEQYLHIQHRPDQGTPIKNKAGGERMIALDDVSCELLDAWIDEIRPDTTDDYGRNPLISTPRGRAHPGTIQNYVYSLTKPCFTESQCPYDRDVDACDAARTNSQAYECPGSTAPHSVRRGALTAWLKTELPSSFITSRADVTEAVILEHYDGRREKQRMNQRRQYLDNI